MYKTEVVTIYTILHSFGLLAQDTGASKSHLLEKGYMELNSKIELIADRTKILSISYTITPITSGDDNLTHMAVTVLFEPNVQALNHPGLSDVMSGKTNVLESGVDI